MSDELSKNVKMQRENQKMMAGCKQPAKSSFAGPAGSARIIVLNIEEFDCLLRILRVAEAQQKRGEDWQDEPIQAVLRAALP